jgi:hypothetical protein
MANGWERETSVADGTNGWESRVSPSMAVHPDAPLGAGGPGHFRHPRLLGEAPAELPHPQSREARRMDPQQIQAAHERSKAASWVEGLIGADHWMELQQAAEVVLGPYSFGVGVCAGIVKNPVSALGGLLQLEKTFILAEMHDRLHKPLSWRTFLGMGLAAELSAEALLTVGVITEHDLDEAAQRRDGIVRELADIFKHPLDFLAGIPAHIRDDYVAKWNRFHDLDAHPDLESQFEAGMILGDVLMDVAMTIATVVSGVGAAVRVASKVPELMRVVGILREARLPAVGVTTAAEAKEAAAAAKMAREPKAVAKAEPEPKTAREPAEKPKPKPKGKTPIAADLANVEVNGVKPVRVRQGTNGKVAVIARNMDYVRAHKAELTEMGYDTEIFDGETIPEIAKKDWAARTEDKTKYLSDQEVMSSEMYKKNRLWAETLRDQGYTVVDLGNPAGKPPSQFYNVECETLFGGSSQ